MCLGREDLAWRLQRVIIRAGAQGRHELMAMLQGAGMLRSFPHSNLAPSDGLKQSFSLWVLINIKHDLSSQELIDAELTGMGPT